MNTSTRRLARKVADTEFDSGWQALCATRLATLTPRQRAFLVRVSADEFRHAGYFGRLASCDSYGLPVPSSDAESSARGFDRRFFADLAVGEAAARAAFWLYRNAWSELSAEIPEFAEIQQDEAAHRFGALLHLRRICSGRVELHQALGAARVRLALRALGLVSAAALAAAVRCAAMGIMLAFWPLMAARARRRVRALHEHK